MRSQTGNWPSSLMILVPLYRVIVIRQGSIETELNFSGYQVCVHKQGMGRLPL